ARRKSDLPIRVALSPVTGNPNPARASPDPVTFDIDGSRSRARNPMTRYPCVTCPSPLPVTPHPNVLRTWRHGLRFHAHGWWRLRHDDLTRYDSSRGNSCRHLLSGSRRGRCDRRRRFLSAADQSQWHQHEHPNAYSHNSPLRITFRFSLAHLVL